jgi:hypothetical protein
MKHPKAARLPRAPLVAPVFFRCELFGVNRSRFATTASIARSARQLDVRFDCPYDDTPVPQPMKPVGDPDVYRKGEYVRVVLYWGDRTLDQVHWTASYDGSRHSEFGNRRINPPNSWECRIRRMPRGWTAALKLPLGFAIPDIRAKLRIALFRCNNAEGLTAWPSPFATWLFARPEGSVPLNAPSRTTVETEDMARGLQRGCYAACRSFPDDDPLWMTRCQELLKPGISPTSLAERLHRRAKRKPFRTFMGRSAAESVPSKDRELNLRTLDVFDRTGRSDRFFRGEMIENIAILYARTGEEYLYERVSRSLDILLRRHPFPAALQRYLPHSQWAPHLGIYTFGLMMRAAYCVSIRRPLENQLVLRLYKLAQELIWFGEATAHNAYHFNHSINWADKVLEIASLCPEMRDAGKWLQAGWRHMRGALNTQILPDGVSQELCTLYNLVAYYRLMEGVDACLDSGIAVPAEMLRWGRLLLEAATVYFLPNGALAGFGDGFMNIDLDGYPSIDEKFVKHLQLGGRRFNRPDLVYIGTGGRSGRKPSWTDHALPYAGLYAARTGWTARDCGLIFDAAPFGRAHQHDDKLNFVYSHKGRCLVLDGTYDMDRHRAFTVSAPAHNTVCVEGFRSDYLSDFSQWVGTSPQENRFEKIAGVHYLEGFHNLVQPGSAAGIRIHRRIVTRLGRFIWVVDRLEGTGCQTVHLRLHLPRGRVSIRGVTFRTCTGDVDLCGFSLAGLLPQVEDGDWSTGPRSRRTIRWTAACVSLPYMHSFLLLPFEADKPRIPQAQAVVNERRCELDLEWPDGEHEHVAWQPTAHAPTSAGRR